MLATRSRDSFRIWREGGLRALGRVAAGAVFLLAAGPPAEAADKPASAGGLTVAILDLAEIPGLAPQPLAAERQPAWRTTFGSERQTEPVVRAVAGSGALAPLAEADAVLIQGVQATAPLRRVFPPQTWRLIVSRGILSASDPVGFRSVRSNRPPTTAIAVRARQDLRVTARTHALRLDEANAGLSDVEAAATAVRLVSGGHTLWIASIALPAACNNEEPPCPALASLDTWRQEKLKGGEPTLIGGRIGTANAPGEKAPAAPVTCTSHTIESDFAWKRLSPQYDSNPPATPTGCISMLRLTD